MTTEDFRAELEDLKSRVSVLEAQRKGTRSPDPLFQQFWDLYPKERRVDKLDATRAWASLSQEDKLAAVAGAEVYALAWATADPSRYPFIRLPATWLRKRTWENGEDEWRRVAGTATAKKWQPPLRGAHPPTTQTYRDVGEASAEWLRELDAAEYSLLRPCIPDDLTDCFWRWRKGEDVPEPDGWREALAAAWEEARRRNR